MSIERTVKIDLDLTVLEEVAVRLGFQAEHNVGPIGYYENKPLRTCDLVVRTPGARFDIGARQTTEGTEMVYDAHSGIADKHLAKIFPEYYETMLRRRGGSFRLTQKEETKDEIVLRVRRGA